MLTSPASQWDGVENKTQVVGYGVGALVLLWFSSTIVSAINVVPLVSGHGSEGARILPECLAHRWPSPLQVPKFLELVGLGYTSWFTYRYLLFKVRGSAVLLVTPQVVQRPDPVPAAAVQQRRAVQGRRRAEEARLGRGQGVRACACACCCCCCCCCVQGWGAEPGCAACSTKASAQDKL